MSRDAANDPYRDIPFFYDLEHESFDEDVDLYLNFIAAAGDPVLELGCGTGRLLLEVARAGYRITGLDQSQPMLDRARDAVVEHGLSSLVTVHQASMRDASDAPGGAFGVVIIPLNGLLHAAYPADQRAILASARAALDPRGQLILDLLNPTPETLRGFDHTLSHEGAWTLEDGTRVDKFAARRLSATTQTISMEIWYDLTSTDGSVRRTATSFPMRYVHRHELELMLEVAGFVEWQVYGSYDLDPYDDHSERLIVAAEVSRSLTALSTSPLS